MLDNQKISVRQFRILVILFTIGTSILIVPATLAFEAKQDAWIAAILGVGMGLLVILLYNKLGLMFPDMTFVQMNQKILGKWLGKMASLLFFSLSFTYASALLFYTGNFFITEIMPETPLGSLVILMGIIMVMAVRYGLETFARSAEIFFLLFFFLFITLVFSLTPEIEVENIQPVFEVEFKPLLRGSIFLVVTSTVNAVVLLMIFPANVNQQMEAQKSFLIGSLIGGLVMIIITLLGIFVLGPYYSATEVYPGYDLTKEINLGDFVTRIDAIMAGMWMITIYFKLILYFYASVLGFTQILEIKDYRPFTLPLGMIAIVLSVIVYPNVVYQQEWDTKTANAYSLTVGLFLPLLLLGVAVFRKKMDQKKHT
ncbi:GerAB/ArcD/ProY family transporter [Pseudalkalibacillus salsuginis]|uniref:GerAB/ArcD/ProY family transporter n=1 Tax=Pseudalkalibacillus salsuginis TaxID=2910972 RepID=UPI001F1B2186|nr:endospore germination permease [Pseudalkalibacillus salsuginis]MCF6409808.1 endospore germination permease [Pseudalkalibacillus salsuginis]